MLADAGINLNKTKNINVTELVQDYVEVRIHPCAREPDLPLQVM